MVDYLLVDYLTVLAQRHDPWIAEAFNEIQRHPDCDELCQKFLTSLMTRICGKDSQLILICSSLHGNKIFLSSMMVKHFMEC